MITGARAVPCSYAILDSRFRLGKVVEKCQNKNRNDAHQSHRVLGIVVVIQRDAFRVALSPATLDSRV